MKDPGAHPNRRPLLALVLPSPVIAEMLSGSTPPLEWLNPVAALLLIWLYGAGVLVMRETAVRWKTGWPSILLLGAAYGIIEEGLAVKSFFDPAWMDLGTLGWYGRWLDVNWVWAVWLTIYHAVVSIAIPIFLMEWIWPRVRGQPLTSRRGYITAIALLAGATIFIDILLTPYRPSVWHLLGASAAVLRRLHDPHCPRRGRGPDRRDAPGSPHLGKSPVGSPAVRVRRGVRRLPDRPLRVPGIGREPRDGDRRRCLRVPPGPPLSQSVSFRGPLVAPAGPPTP